MLAQNFLPYQELHLRNEDQREALIKVLGRMERGEIKDEDFSMGLVQHCILGHASRVNRSFHPEIEGLDYDGGAPRRFPPPVFELFGFSSNGQIPENSVATVAQAAQALRNFLTTGEARWDDIMEEKIREKYLYPYRPDVPGGRHLVSYITSYDPGLERYTFVSNLETTA